MAKKPYKPPNQVRSKLLPVRISEEEAAWIFPTAKRLGMTVSDLMRKGARFYAMEIEQKGEPGKERESGSQKKVVSAGKRQGSPIAKRNRLQAPVSKTKA